VNPKEGVRGLVKASLYRSGITPAYHQRRNRRSLTVVMFHRVLPVGDPEWADTEAIWTVSDSAFRECLEFFERHYHVIGLPDLHRARHDAGELPDRSVLITFDDGWADTEWCALPILKAAGLPALVFVVAGGVGEEELWQESIRRAWRQGRMGAVQCADLWRRATQTPQPVAWDGYALEELIQRIATAAPDLRSGILAGLPSWTGKPLRSQMLTEEQLRTLHSAGVSIGSHGLTHVPISQAADPVEELRSSRSRLAAMLKVPESEIGSLSFPHGLYDDSTLIRAVEAGYEWVFTSDKGLHATPRGQALPRVLGRLNMDGPQLCAETGKLRPERLASWLFDRPTLQLKAA
jgi:peptidoglycan/xylan/chitin deacetylase (PgdA/CDA1 family)